MEQLKVGDHVTWNSDVGYVTGRITRVHVADVEFPGKIRRASHQDPQFEVKSDKTGALAMHKAAAVKKVTH
jgi:hypothetical protein